MMVFNTQFYINNFQPSFANDMPTFSSSSSMFKPYPLVIKFGNGTSTMLLPWSSQLKSNSIELEGFPIYFLSHICPIYFQSISPWLSCGFPMVFLWFSYGFPHSNPPEIWWRLQASSGRLSAGRLGLRTHGVARGTAGLAVGHFYYPLVI